jgi:ribosomal protein L40E
MMNEKTCRKCNKQYPPNVVFCPDCGSLTLGPEAPVEASPVSPVRAKRTSKGMPVRSLPIKKMPVKVLTVHTRDDFFKGLATNNVPEQDVDVIKRLMEWSEGVADSVSYGDTIAENGRVGFRPTLRLQDQDVSLFWISTDGRVEIPFENWIYLAPFDSREMRVEMLGKLNGIKGVRIPENKIAARTPIPVKMLREQAEFDKFIAIYEWFLGLARGQ